MDINEGFIRSPIVGVKALDDIKHTARKEKKKKEQKDMERWQTKPNVGQMESKIFVLAT